EMLAANILFGSLLLLKNYETVADFGKNSSSLEESNISKDQCYGLCNQIKPILSHIGNFQPVWNKGDTGVNKFENRLKNMEAQLAVFEASKRKPQPDLAKFVKIGSRYFYIDEMNKLNWFAAFKYCREIGGKLALIQDEAELNKISDLVDWVPSFWVGINALINQERFQIWPSKGKKVQPFLNGLYSRRDYYKRCMTLCDSTFRDSNCNENLHFICEAVLED
ncbi:hypothetical protein KR074_011162, partial [Drosophila pseudoananassae]